GPRILVLHEGSGVGASIAESLRVAGGHPIVVRRGVRFQQIDERHYTLDPMLAQGFKQLAAKVCAHDERLAGVIDCWSAAPPGTTDLDEAGVVTLLGPMRLGH